MNLALIHSELCEEYAPAKKNGNSPHETATRIALELAYFYTIFLIQSINTISRRVNNMETPHIQLERLLLCTLIDWFTSISNRIISIHSELELGNEACLYAIGRLYSVFDV